MKGGTPPLDGEAALIEAFTDDRDRTQEVSWKNVVTVTTI